MKEQTERWMELCAQAAIEQDPGKLLSLVEEINRLLLQKERRLGFPAKKRKKLRGTVQQVIKPIVPTDPEKAQINIEQADDLYRELRVENLLTDDEGKKARLEEGDEVEVTLEAELGR